VKSYIIAVMMALCFVATVRAETYNDEAKPWAVLEHQRPLDNIPPNARFKEPATGYPDWIQVQNENVRGITKGVWPDPYDDNATLDWIVEDPREVPGKDKVEVRVENRQSVGSIYYVVVVEVRNEVGVGEDERELWADAQACEAGRLYLRDGHKPEVFVYDDGDNDPDILYCQMGGDKGKVIIQLKDAYLADYQWVIFPDGGDPGNPLYNGDLTHADYEDMQAAIDPGKYTLKVEHSGTDFERRLDFVVVGIVIKHGENHEETKPLYVCYESEEPVDDLKLDLDNDAFYCETPEDVEWKLWETDEEGERTGDALHSDTGITYGFVPAQLDLDPGKYNVTAECPNVHDTEDPGDFGDERDVVVIQANADITRLEGQIVAEDKKHSEGSIIKIYTPGHDTSHDGTRVEMPMEVLPEDVNILSDLTFRLEKIGPSTSVKGDVRILRDSSVFLPEGQNEAEIEPEDLSGIWEIEGRETGVVDIALIIYHEGDELCRDTVRVSCSPVLPRSGNIKLVNEAGELDVEDWEAYLSILDALGDASSLDNVAIARGDYNEHSLNVDSSGLLVVGLGGSFFQEYPEEYYNFNFGNLPVIDGGYAGSIFEIDGKNNIQISALKITKGNAPASVYGGGGISGIETQNITISLNVISDNVAIDPRKGGGIFFKDSVNVFIKECEITGNAALAGGGIFLRDCTYNNITNNVITSNLGSRYGGGIGIQGTKNDIYFGHVKRNTISENENVIVGGGIGIAGKYDSWENLTAATPTAGYYGAKYGARGLIRENEIKGNGMLVHHDDNDNNETRGGGLYIAGKESVITSIENAYENNGIQGDGGGVSVFNKSHINSEDDTISENESGDGAGGINFGADGTGDIKNAAIDGNFSSEHGGGIHASLNSWQQLNKIKVENSRIRYNEADQKGGGISVRNHYIESLGENWIRFNDSGDGGGGVAAYSRITSASVFTPRTHLSLTEGDLIEGNSTEGDGGGVFGEKLELGAPRLQVIIKNAEISANSAASNVGDNWKTSGIFFLEPKRASANTFFDIENNLIQNHEGVGYTRLQGTDMLIPDSLQKNEFKYNMVGLYLDQHSPLKVYDNFFWDNSKYDIFCGSIEDNIEIEYNGFNSQNSGIGVAIQAGEDPVKLRDNIFIGYNHPENCVAVYVWSGPEYIDAQNNYWGDPDGPNTHNREDGDDNSSENGSYISDWVDYRPFLTSGP